FMTDEIDLDAELQKAEESAILRGKLTDKPSSSKGAPFELSEPDLTTSSMPKPQPKAGDSMSDFDLALNQDDLSLELSSSEFELTLEDSAKLAHLEDEAKSEDDKDIFATDFEVPALEDSDSGVAPLEDSSTDLESSDFDLALSDEDMVTEEESGSQVVAL